VHARIYTPATAVQHPPLFSLFSVIETPVSIEQSPSNAASNAASMLLLLSLQGTRVERVINELFEGHTLNFIECVNVDYKSSRRESFMDLQLDVKGCPNIYDSFDRCVECNSHCVSVSHTFWRLN
jgi:hypothetical protein